MFHHRAYLHAMSAMPDPFTPSVAVKTSSIEFDWLATGYERFVMIGDVVSTMTSICCTSALLPTLSIPVRNTVCMPSVRLLNRCGGTHDVQAILVFAWPIRENSLLMLKQPCWQAIEDIGFSKQLAWKYCKWIALTIWRQISHGHIFLNNYTNRNCHLNGTLANDNQAKQLAQNIQWVRCLPLIKV